MKAEKFATGKSTKVQPRYKDPYVITDVLSSGTYRITKLIGETKSQVGTTAHESQMKICRARDRHLIFFSEECEDDSLVYEMNGTREMNEKSARSDQTEAESTRMPGRTRKIPQYLIEVEG